MKDKQTTTERFAEFSDEDLHKIANTYNEREDFSLWDRPSVENFISTHEKEQDEDNPYEQGKVTAAVASDDDDFEEEFDEDNSTDEDWDDPEEEDEDDLEDDEEDN